MRRIALTFDDGPSVWSEQILEALAVNDAHATFFVIGSVVRENSDILLQMVAAGHEVGNHTWSHPRLAEDCDDDRVRKELSRTNDVLTEILGVPPRRFRAPRYNVDARVQAVAADLGLRHTHGDVTPPDWNPRCSSQFIATYVLQQARHGAVIGLHDGIPPSERTSGKTRQPTVDAVETILPRLRERGFECVTASALLDGDNEPDLAADVRKGV